MTRYQRHSLIIFIVFALAVLTQLVCCYWQPWISTDIAATIQLPAD